MITHIEGTLLEKTPTYAVIDCNGVGYFLNISLNTYSNLPNTNKVKLLAHLAIKEDAHTLYGFADEAERNLFRQLISVNGVGAGTARMMLSSLSPLEIQKAIVSGDVILLQRIKGIGLKSAQRIIIDLKDKLSKDSLIDLNLGATSGSKVREEALAALVMLGFAKPAAEKAVEKAIKSTEGELLVENLIKIALKNL
jgi:holliday junction DNA helicase RuvA